MYLRKFLLPHISQLRHISALIKADGKPPSYLSSVESALLIITLPTLWGYIQCCHHKMYHRWPQELMITLFWLMEQSGITGKFQGKSCTLLQQLALDHFSWIIIQMRSRPSTGVSSVPLLGYLSTFLAY